MAPPQKNLDVWAGNTFTRRFNFKDSSGGPFDLTGSKLVFRAVSGDTVIRKATDSVDSGFEITDAVNCVVELHFTVAETRDLPASTIRYEIEQWDGDEQVTMLYGNLEVTTWVNDDVDP